MANPLVEVQKFGQSIWYDNIRRGIITSGQLQSMVDDDGLLGITSNPAIFEKAVVGSHDYDQAIKALVGQGVASSVDVYERLAMEDIQWAADVMHPVYVRTNARDGYVSFEVAPSLANDAKGTVEYARRAWATIGRENVLIKVPGTPEGMHAIQTLIGEGISVNVTLLFSVEAYEACAEAYLAGLEKYVGTGRNPGRVASVASFFISRIDTLVDDKLKALAEKAGDAAKKKQIEDLYGKVAIANGIVAYESYKRMVASDRWRALAAKGAQTQRVLWASTSTKNPAYPKTKYVDDLIAPDTVNTIPEETFVEYRKSGKPHAALVGDWDKTLADAKATMKSLEAVGISMKDVTDTLLKDGIKKFVEPFNELIDSIEKKRRMLQAA
ncbi:transaldolase [Candidatus Binatia bacterium]|nr:transaldolase [Candidatus Binatia bacterium]